jgi:hypothetical protein
LFITCTCIGTVCYISRNCSDIDLKWKKDYSAKFPSSYNNEVVIFMSIAVYSVYDIGFQRLILFDQLTFDISSGISLLMMISRKTHVYSIQ